jgi:hypothetical protein
MITGARNKLCALEPRPDGGMYAIGLMIATLSGFLAGVLATCALVGCSLGSRELALRG